MVEGLGASTANEHVRALVASAVPETSPGTFRLLEADVARHGELVRDAWQRLGSPGTAPMDPWAHLHALQELHARRVPSPVVPVDLGTLVRMPDAPLDPIGWTVTGVAADGQVSLVRRLEDGAMQQAQRSWASLVTANPRLAAGHQIYPFGFDKPGVVLRPLPLDEPTASLIDELVPRAKASYEAVVPLGPDGKELVVASGAWDDLASRFHVGSTTPAPRFPVDAWNAASLLDVAAPKPLHQITIAADAETFLGTRLLAGVNGSLPTGHPAARTLRELEGIESWMRTRLGLPTWNDRMLFLTHGDPQQLGNAAASYADEAAWVWTGTQDPSLLRSLRHQLPHETGKAVTTQTGKVQHAWRGVLAHEVGHVATQQLWGTGALALKEAAKEAGDLARVARLAEHDLVEEAFSDLFAAAWTRNADIGIRQLGRLRHGMGDLTQLRATITAAGATPRTHFGTQLLTKPMLQVADLHGWDAMGEVTAGAAKRLGTELATGGIEAIDIPRAAGALRDAAATRWGVDSEVVVGLEQAWHKLHVLPAAAPESVATTAAIADGVQGAAVATGSGLSTAAKVGIGIGIAAGVAAIGVGIWALAQRSRRD